MNIYN